MSWQCSGQIRDAVVDEVKRLPAILDACTPHRAVYRAASLPEPDERADVAVVIPANVGGIELCHRPGSTCVGQAARSWWPTTILDRPASRCPTLRACHRAMAGARSGSISVAATAHPSISSR